MRPLDSAGTKSLIATDGVFGSGGAAAGAATHLAPPSTVLPSPDELYIA
jgi:hypothetical protein